MHLTKVKDCSQRESGVNEEELDILATHTVALMYPESHRASYIDDVSGDYNASEIVYALQHLSVGLTSIFAGLIANWVYDKIRHDGKEEEISLYELIERQSEHLEQLNRIIESGRSRYPYIDLPPQEISDEHKELAKFHEMQLLRIKECDPAIAEMVEEAVDKLESRGTKALTDELQDIPET